MIRTIAVGCALVALLCGFHGKAGAQLDAETRLARIKKRGALQARTARQIGFDLAFYKWLGGMTNIMGKEKLPVGRQPRAVH